MANQRKLAVLAVVLGLGWFMVTASAEVVDRTIAVVNHHLVTWSDLDEQMRFEALENKRPPNEVREAERRAAFDHLVEYRILRDQMQGSAAAEAAEVDSRVGEVRAAWQMEKDEGKWTATLDHYGLTSVELRSLVANQLEILHFVEFQVRPLVRVSREEVEDYYKNTLSPQVLAAGQVPEPVEQLAPQIRELLMEQKTNAEMAKWLEGLKAQSKVQILWDGVR